MMIFSTKKPKKAGVFKIFFGIVCAITTLSALIFAFLALKNKTDEENRKTAAIEAEIEAIIAENYSCINSNNDE